MTLLATHPRLENGATMSRAEFHRIYSECEELDRVELIEGVVYLPWPIKVKGHGAEQTLAIVWLDTYASLHEGVECVGPATVLLDDENEPEPDAMLFFDRPDRYEDDYLLGPPELIVEIANTSVSRDLHEKKRAYARAGVLEYIVWRVQDNVIDWFRLEGDRYELVAPVGGRVASATFDGLVLDVPAMLARDRAKVLGALT